MQTSLETAGRAAFVTRGRGSGLRTAVLLDQRPGLSLSLAKKGPGQATPFCTFVYHAPCVTCALPAASYL
jgi:hypothetical protein